MYRFAPSPTGDMHIGNLRAALINYICAKQNKDKFILRIEDTDDARNIDGKEEDIKELLTRFGIKWDLYFLQSDNFSIHQKLALKLVQEGKAFACFCTKEELEAKKEKAKKESKAYRYDGACLALSDSEVLNNEKPFVIRLKKPEQSIGFSDKIKGDLMFEPDNIDSFVILRTDKTPTYNFACAVDDMLEDVSYIIRGEDHVSNTPKQEHIRTSLGYDKNIQYAHLPIILNEEGRKMSKREAHSSVKWLLSEGILESAIANYLILLGNNTPKEVFTLDEAISFFDIAKLSKSPARFDSAKLMFINREHIKMLNDDKLFSLMSFDRVFNSSLVSPLAKLYLEEASTINEIEQKVKNLLNDIDDSEFIEEINTLKPIILELFENGFNGDFDEFKKVLMEKSNLKGKKFFMPLRLLLTSSSHGPELAPLYPLIKPFIKDIIKDKKIKG